MVVKWEGVLERVLTGARVVEVVLGIRGEWGGGRGQLHEAWRVRPRTRCHWLPARVGRQRWRAIATAGNKQHDGDMHDRARGGVECGRLGGSGGGG